MDTFLEATRLKLRFNYKGQCSVEDLWDLPLKALDAIYKDLVAEKRAETEESLLNVKSRESEIVDLKIAIVKHVVETRLAEQHAKAERQQNAAERQKILDIIARKQNSQLEDLSIEELQAKAESLR